MVTRQEFQELHSSGLGNKFRAAASIFLKYGPGFSDDVSGLIEMAIEQGKVDLILEQLDQCYRDHYANRKRLLANEVETSNGQSVRRQFGVFYRNVLGVDWSQGVEELRKPKV